MRSRVDALRQRLQHYVVITDNKFDKTAPENFFGLSILADNNGDPANFSFNPVVLFKSECAMSSKLVSLEGLSVSDLTALQAQIDERIKTKHLEVRQEVKNKILALLAESGFSLSDLFPSGKNQQAASGVLKQKVKVKYSDGKNNWTGRGRMPLWVKSFIQTGGELASLDVLK